MLFPRILALALVFSAPAFAAPPASSVASSQKKVEVAPGTLVITRVENEILLAWALQPGDVRSQEVMRNNTTATAGRKRLMVVGAGAKTYSDFVPEGSEPFTYWIKVTRPDLTNYNIGPVTAPALAPATSTPAKPAR